jgi:hypothetical protein
LIRKGVLENARFAVAVLVKGMKDEQPLLIRWDASFPTLYQIRRRGLMGTPITYATAHVAALFIKFFPRELAGVFAPEILPREARRAIISKLRGSNLRITHKTSILKHDGEDEEEI